MRRSLEVLVWRPTETKRRAVETLAVAGDMEAAFKTELERERFVERYFVLKSEDRKTVGAVDAVLELITTDDGSVFAEPRLNAQRGFARRVGAAETGSRQIGDRRNHCRRETLGQEYSGPGVDFVVRGDRRLIRISRVRFAEVLFAFDRDVEFFRQLNLRADGHQIRVRRFVDEV